jgi:2-polyprenyl-3-methyl-5-hydroxy-6-metoxy-1,4-benzoquinol methylase
MILKEAEKYAIRELTNHKERTIVEIGCGKGVILLRLAKKFKDNTFIGIDINKTELKIANSMKKKEKIKNVHFYHANIFNYNHNPFDIVISIEVLEHIKDVDAFLGKINNLLKIDGTLILSTPNKSNYPRILFDKIITNKSNEMKKHLKIPDQKKELVEGHISVQESKELKMRLINTGFEIKGVSRMPPLYGGEWVDNSKLIYNLNFVVDSILPRHHLLDFGWDQMIYAKKKKDV